MNEKQLHTLRTCYAANPRPDALMKEQLVEMTGLSPRVIRVWFQNKRCKDKKKAILMKQIQQQEKVGHHPHHPTHLDHYSTTTTTTTTTASSTGNCNTYYHIRAMMEQSQSQHASVHVHHHPHDCDSEDQNDVRNHPMVASPFYSPDPFALR